MPNMQINGFRSLHRQMPSATIRASEMLPADSGGSEKTMKAILTPLKRENRGIKEDPQFSPYMPSYKWIVFHDYGHPTHQGSNTFLSKKDAEHWINDRARKEADL